MKKRALIFLIILEALMIISGITAYQNQILWRIVMSTFVVGFGAAAILITILMQPKK